MTPIQFLETHAVKRRQEWHALILDWHASNAGAPLPPWLERRADLALAYAMVLEWLVRFTRAGAVVLRPSRWPIDWALLVDAAIVLALCIGLGFVVLWWFW